MKRRGFTLIELLAVIVILAIIALIAVPIVLNIIENARKGSAKSSALAYIKAVETYNAVSMLDKNAKILNKNIKYNCTKETIVDSQNTLAINEYVELKGYMPTGSKDYIMLNSSKTVEEGQLTINGYFIVIKEGKIISIEKGSYVDVEKIELNYTEQTMEKGSTFKLSAIFTPSNASDQRVTFASSDESVVKVNEEGIVTAVNNGNAKIIVTSKDNTSKKAECNITVVTSATGVSIEPTESEVGIGKTIQLVGTIEPGDVTTNALTWTSSNDNVAHVDENGLVTGMSVGTVTITAKTVNGKTATAVIEVKEIYAGISNITYTTNQTVTYQGISFQVVKDNGNTVTLVTTNDVGSGQFGSSASFGGSTAYNFVNITWVNANRGIKDEINNGGIITDPTTNSKVRLLTTSEVSGKPSGSGRTFWTMTTSGNNVYYARANGSTSYSYVSGTSLTSASTVTSPSSTTGRVDDTYSSKTQKRCGDCSAGNYNCDGHISNPTCICTTESSWAPGKVHSEYCTETTTTTYTLTSTNTKPIGYRPVITVKKK